MYIDSIEHIRKDQTIFYWSWLGGRLLIFSSKRAVNTTLFRLIWGWNEGKMVRFAFLCFPFYNLAIGVFFLYNCFSSPLIILNCLRHIKFLFACSYNKFLSPSNTLKKIANPFRSFFNFPQLQKFEREKIKTYVL